jgi:hypothetical protein
MAGMNTQEKGSEIADAERQAECSESFGIELWLAASRT